MVPTPIVTLALLLAPPDAGVLRPLPASSRAAHPGAQSPAGPRADAGHLDRGHFEADTTDAGTIADGAIDAGAVDAGPPSSWRLSTRLPPGSSERAALLAELTAPTSNDPSTVGEASLTHEEAEALLSDPRADLVYADKTIAITAPSMLARQRRDHLDLMKAFLAPERVEAGARFAAEHAAVLQAAETKHGVSRTAVVAILLWETKLGTITGDWVAFNALASQAFFARLASAVALSRAEERRQLDPERHERRVEAIERRARRNLVALVRQCRAKGIDPLTVKGSWAGALGYPQFMPASLRWADDGDGDGRIDLFDFDDAIFSVARYLAEHGWATSREGAVWAYNHEDAYVKGVLAYAQALERRLATKRAAPPK